jgi:N-acetylglutamate synthase-like GNAT family acetyltransferase
MTAFTIQKAGPQNSTQIRDLIERVDINTRGLEWRRFLVALGSMGQIVGCGQVKDHPGGILELASIAVDPKWRGQGVARAIIEALISQHAAEPLYLMTESGLGSLYARFGFRRIEEAEMPTYFRRMLKLPGFIELFANDGLEVIVMKRDPNQ